MAKIIANDIKVGNIIEHKGGLWEVLKAVHTKPGKGGAFIQAEMKEIIKKTKLNERFRSVESVEKAILDEEEYQFLYKSDSMMMLMSKADYDQCEMELSLLGDKVVYLQEDVMVTILSYNENPIKAQLPKHMIFMVKEADSVIKGQTAAASYKPAVLENGLSIKVPLFIKAGDKIVVNTEDNSYVERAK